MIYYSFDFDQLIIFETPMDERGPYIDKNGNRVGFFEAFGRLYVADYIGEL